MLQKYKMNEEPPFFNIGAENFLKDKQFFYYNKPVKVYKNFSDFSGITIAIPTHNGGRTIKSMLGSVINRLEELPLPPEKEIVICLDHCNDDTKLAVKDVVNRIATDNVIIKLIDNHYSKGKALALNSIFENSSKEIFCSIDDDVILEKMSLVNLLKTLIENPEVRCVFSVWKRLPFKSGNPWKLFWHYVLGVKFDIQPYVEPREIMRGACMMFRRENFVKFPPVLNEDQFLQYIYWPKTREVQDSIVYFNSVSSIFDYYRRSLRIMAGSKQLSRYFTKERIKECPQSFASKIDYAKIAGLPLRQGLAFLLYLFIKHILNIFKKIRLFFNSNYKWFRFKQG